MHESHSPCARLFAAGAALALTGGLTGALASGSAPAGAATPNRLAFGGSAFGSYVTLGSIAHSGRTAYTPMCTPYAGARHSNKTARVDLGPAGYIGAVTGATASVRSGPTSRSEASTHTAATALLGGVVRLRAVTTVAKVSRYRSGYGTRGTSVFTGLTVAGRSFSATPPPNSRYTLPGLGNLTLNGQHASSGNGLRAMTTTALNLVIVKGNTAHLPAGQILIGRSTATLRPIKHVPSGKAFGTEISVGSAIKSGRTAAVYSSCGGTGNAVRKNDVAGVNVPNGVATVGTVRSAVHTTDLSTRSTSTAVNSIAKARLLGGEVSLQGIRTEAQVVYSHGRRTVSGARTRLLGLTVAGRSYASPALRTQRHIKGLGTLYFGSTRRTSVGIVVYGLRLVLDTPRDGLRAGTVLTLGYAYAAVRA